MSDDDEPTPLVDDLPPDDFEMEIDPADLAAMDEAERLAKERRDSDLEREALELWWDLP